MLAAPNALMITGGATTVMEAFEVLPVPPFVEVTWTLLFFTPAVVPCTFTVTVQLPLAATIPPERLTCPIPQPPWPFPRRCCSGRSAWPPPVLQAGCP